MSRVALVLVVSLGLLLVGCGGVLSQSPANPGQTASANPNPVPSPAPAPAALSQPHVVTVESNRAVAGVDINVSTPQDSPSPNAQMLGVTNLGNGGSAGNVGDLIHRGAKMTILMFGPGLSGALTVSISGPNDIAVSNVRAVTSVDGDSGLAFDAAVDANAALGARTVRLRSPHDDLTTFTGGLEVLP